MLEHGHEGPHALRAAAPAALAAKPLNVAICNIIIEDRQRQDLGDINALASSIRQFGIIQPIVLTTGTESQIRLVAGGRRLAACQLLGFTELVHARDFVWREEQDAGSAFRLQAVELEENLRRKELHWSEHVLAKQKLFILMQQLHGVSRGWAQGRSRSDGDGFSLRKLAAMLGENPSITSRDLDLASYLTRFPDLAKCPVKVDALRKVDLATKMASMKLAAASPLLAKQAATAPISAGADAASSTSGTLVGAVPEAAVVPSHSTTAALWTLFEGQFQQHIAQVPSGTVDLVLTDLPYNIGAAALPHSAGLAGFEDENLDMEQLCFEVAEASFRVLRDDRFGVFFYGFAYYQTLLNALKDAGFVVDVYPFVWLRDRTPPPNGYARYSKSYDPALIASKGAARFIRPNMPNTTPIASVRGADRMHATQKPVALMRKFIDDMVLPHSGCCVLDMFAGSGTTGVAALQAGCRCLLFEQEPNNCLIIRSRLGVL